MRIVTLITDYGTRDYYVGALKGVILSIAPDVRLVDITHDIEPHNISHGAFVLRHVWPVYPPDTIHLVVVDPGVGSPRRILIGKYAGGFVVAPDNGLITWLHRDFPPQALHLVENQHYFLPSVSTTFHGRDIMAPVAAHLANDVDLHQFGPATDRAETLSMAFRAERIGHGFRGCVIYVDRFGNLVSNIHQDQFESEDEPQSWEVSVNGSNIGPIREAFFEVPAGEPVAMIGSTGFLEIAVREGTAIERFGPADAAAVEVLPQPRPSAA